MKPILFAVFALLALVPTTVHAAPADPASAVVQKFLDTRAAGSSEAAYALWTKKSQTDMPPPAPKDVTQIITYFDNPKTMGQVPIATRIILALFADIQNKLNYKFHVLGPDPIDHNVVLLRAYRVGTPLSTIQTVKIFTAPDPAAGGALRIDAEATFTRSDPSMARSVGRAGGNPAQAVSLSNEKQICLAVIQYAYDHDEHYPDADKWVDEIMPYLKTEAVFHDPADPDKSKWDYAFNRNLSGAKLSDISNPSATVAIFESATGTKNASDIGTSVPHPGRHSGVTAYGFADGHCRLLPDTAPAPSFLLMTP